MNLDIETWQPFHINRLFDINAGIYYYQDDYSEGTTPYCSASAVNNGISKYIDIEADFEGNKIITGKVGCNAFYQPLPFCATSDVNILSPKFQMNRYIGLFITTIINKNENYRWNYGRQCRVQDTKNIVIKLPIKYNEDLTPFYDEKKLFSDNGFVPDWEYMESYIKRLHCKPIKSETKSQKKQLCTQFWKGFYLHKLFYTSMGSGIDAIVTSSDNPKYNYVSRDSNGNGVVSFVDEIEGVKPFPAGSMTLALGGSYLGSCFIQPKEFYTAQNVGVLQEKEPLSILTKLFISAVVRNECKMKYQAFGRELNCHFRKNFILKLPIKTVNDKPIIDSKKKYSEEGFIPDWDWMNDYMLSLPFSEKLLNNTT